MNNIFLGRGWTKAAKAAALIVFLSFSVSHARAEDVQEWHYPSCNLPSTDSNAGPSVPACPTGEQFHLDESTLSKIVTNYTCADDTARTTFTFDVSPPQIAVAMYQMASKAVHNPSLPDNERRYVAGQIEGYEHDVSRARQTYRQLLMHAVAEMELDSGQVNHPESAGIRQSLSVPSSCSHRQSEENTKFTIVITTAAIQRFSSVVWRDATDSITRANKEKDLDAAHIAVPQFVLQANIDDSVAKIYSEATGKPIASDHLTMIDIINGKQYSTISVPLQVLPSPAQHFLASQSSDIEQQLERIDGTVHLPSAIFVSEPQSTKVFSHEFWVEHIMWQLAARSVINEEELRLDRSQYLTYGLH